jgi:hypothetical protein
MNEAGRKPHGADGEPYTAEGTRYKRNSGYRRAGNA